MRILVANDDGIYSPGILALARSATQFGDVRIVAPDVEQSSMSHAITHSRPLSVKRTPIDGFEAYRVNGTPADCVAVGLYLWQDVEVVLSGINLGYNLGNSVWHSGTLAAAKQAALLGCRGIAFSTPTRGEEPDFDRLAEYVHQVLELLIPEDSLCLVNVNLPSEPTGLCWARQSVRHYDSRVVEDEDPSGRRIYWVAIKPVEEVEEGTDRWAVRRGLVSLTPLRLDLTDDAALRRTRERIPIETDAAHAGTPAGGNERRKTPNVR